MHVYFMCLKKFGKRRKYIYNVLGNGMLNNYKDKIIIK